tara:strand:+ start:930 stop:2024 length:1095 start_codon:yes stop_codon:yes gene_type:complete
MPSIKQTPATISQVTKCVKKNMHNVQINLKKMPDFEQSTEFVVLREHKSVEIETSLSSKSINEDKNSLLYKENEVIDIPKKLNESFDNNLDTCYYIFGVPQVDSFFYSLLFVISKEFKLKEKNVRADYITNLKDSLTKQVPTLFRNNKYSKYAYKCSDILANIEDSNKISEGLMCAVTDYFNINLIVLNYDTDKYWLGKEYNSDFDEKNVVLIYSNGTYLPLIHIYGEMPSNFIYKCIVNRFKIYRKLATQTEMSVVEQEINKPQAPQQSVENNKEETLVATESEVPTPGNPVLYQDDLVSVNIPSTTASVEKIELKAFRNYKIVELQTLANKNNIEITHNVDGVAKPKNKTKRMLYDELSKLS